MKIALDNFSVIQTLIRNESAYHVNYYGIVEFQHDASMDVKYR